MLSVGDYRPRRHWQDGHIEGHGSSLRFLRWRRDRAEACALELEVRGNLSMLLSWQDEYMSTNTARILTLVDGSVSTPKDPRSAFYVGFSLQATMHQDVGCTASGAGNHLDGDVMEQLARRMEKAAALLLPTS